MEINEIVDRLVTLLEAERAGVVVSRALMADTRDPVFTDLLTRVLDGERDSCRMLGRMILKAGKSGGSGVGDFSDKVMALEGDTSRLQLLIKGQDWVVRKLEELLTEDLPEGFSPDIREIRDVHVQNIDLCRQYLENIL